MEQSISQVQGGTKTQKTEISGNARLLIGFMAGAVFAFLPVYYYYVGRDAGLRAGSPSTSDTTPQESPPVEVAKPSVSKPSQANRFASRLTYELKRLPEEPPRAPVRPAPPPVAAPAVVQAPPTPPAPVAPVVTAAPVTAAPAPAAQPKPAPAPVAAAPAPAPSAKAPPPPAPSEPVAVVPGPRITNARPIRVDPLEARDTTREIAKDVRKAEAPPTKEARKGDAPIEARSIIAPAAPVKPAAPPPPVQVAIAPANEAAAPTAPRAPAEGDVVAARYAATRDWLASAPESTHTIQIMGISNDAQLKAHLASLGKTLEGSKIYIFRTAAHGKPWVTVVYGAYADRKAALQALEKLPPTLGGTKPVLRTVNGIRAEMKQNGTS